MACGTIKFPDSQIIGYYGKNLTLRWEIMRDANEIIKSFEVYSTGNVPIAQSGILPTAEGSKIFQNRLSGTDNIINTVRIVILFIQDVKYTDKRNFTFSAIFGNRSHRTDIYTKEDTVQVTHIIGKTFYIIFSFAFVAEYSQGLFQSN